MPTEERFDFDTLPDRNDTGSAKWNRRTDEEKRAGTVPMSIADMEFRCAPCVIDAAARAASHGVFGYTDADGKYFDAVTGWMERRHGFKADREWILPQNGVVPAVCVAVRAFTEPGDGVLIQSPGYFPFGYAVTQNGRRPVYNQLLLGEDGRYRMDLADLREKAAQEDVKLMILCSPHNPVGRIWSVDELRAVADICLQNGVLVVSDEIHMDLELYGKHTMFPLAAPEIKDRCVVLTAPSKTFNLAGLQLANTLIENADLRARYKKRMNADGYSNASYFGYHATIAAYSEGEPWLDALIRYVRGNFDFFHAWLEENLPMVRLLPVEGTYLAWTDWRALSMTDAELERFVRGDALLFLDEGTLFGAGGEGFMRFNLALPREALKRELARLLQVARRRGIV